MIRPHTVIFCQKVEMLAGNQPLIMRPYPGGVAVGPAKDQALVFDVYTALQADAPGTYVIDMRFLTPGGVACAEQLGMPVRIDDAEVQSQLSIHGIHCPVDRGGSITMQYRVSGTEAWHDAGTLLVRVVAPPEFEGTSFEIPAQAIG
jgi:hypothetical protein